MTNHRPAAAPGKAAPHLAATFYPAFLSLRGRCCVVVGGGVVAEQKVAGLLEAGARVTVISGTISRRIEDLAAAGTVAIERRPYRTGDLEGAVLAIAATNDPAVNRDVWVEAERRAILVNAVDDPAHSSFIAPAIHRQGHLTVAVSTAGRSPALAVRVRDRIRRLLGTEYAEYLELLGELRGELAARVPDASARTRLWYRIVDSDVIGFLRRHDPSGARQRIRELLRNAETGQGLAAEEDGGGSESGRPPHRCGTVYLVGAGPGEPGLITLRGLEILRAAEVVVYDRLVHRDLVNEAPQGAERVFAGKCRGGHTMEQEQINAVLIAAARKGRCVVRLKAGDPFVFGRGAEECQALHAANVPFEVIPGVTAATAAPAAAGIAVTHRRYASAFAVVTGHECEGASDLDWEALARLPVLVILMGLRTGAEITARLIAHGMPSETPAAMIASATLP
ncbi:MAG TPA: siroheme synthase CysG, partial [Gemmatimonadales bacterium]|nr:siroheme synthase CysG [Gemmatimonadales bacterium]